MVKTICASIGSEKEESQTETDERVPKYTKDLNPTNCINQEKTLDDNQSQTMTVSVHDLEKVWSRHWRKYVNRTTNGNKFYRKLAITSDYS